MGYKKLPPLELPDNYGLAYLAGVIDSDGHIGCTRAFDKKSSRNVSHAIRVVITNSSDDLMFYLETIGGSKRLKRHKRYDKDSSRNPERWKPTYNWQVSGPNAETLLLAVLPYLIVKKAQAEIALKIRKLGKHKWKGRDGLDPELVKERESLTVNLNDLNSRGLQVH